MKNIEKYLSILTDEVDGLLLTSRYSRMYGAELTLLKASPSFPGRVAATLPIAAILNLRRTASRASKCWK